MIGSFRAEHHFMQDFSVEICRERFETGDFVARW